jgi:hypothetical protein
MTKDVAEVAKLRVSLPFVIRHSGLFRHSGFDIRHSEPTSGASKTHRA